MMTFGDCMSLLVTFFVMLIAFSNMDEYKLLDLIGALKGGLRVVPADQFGAGTLSKGQELTLTYGTSPKRKLVSAKELSAISRYKETYVRRFARHQLTASEKHVTLSLLDQGFTLLIHATGLFEKGTARFRPDAEHIWGAFADIAAELEHEIRIVGVVDADTPIRSERFGTPWGLGMERAAAVKRLLTEDCEIPPDRFSLGVDASEHAPTRTDLSANRMELIIVGYYPTIERTASEIILREM